MLLRFMCLIDVKKRKHYRTTILCWFNISYWRLLFGFVRNEKKKFCHSDHGTHSKRLSSNNKRNSSNNTNFIRSKISFFLPSFMKLTKTLRRMKKKNEFYCASHRISHYYLTFALTKKLFPMKIRINLIQFYLTYFVLYKKKIIRK